MPVWTRVREWSRLFSEYAAAQAVIQALGVLAGLWLVNLLPVHEYALYAFALSIFTFLTVFSDLGVSGALLFFRRETRIAGAPFAPYVRAALGLRRALVGLGTFVGLAFLILMGRERGFGLVELTMAGLALAAAAWLQVSASMGLLLLRLEGEYRDSYLAEVAGNATRIIGIALLWMASAPIAWLAMLTGASGSFATAALVGRRGRLRLPIAAEAREPVNRPPARAIGRYILPTLPGAAYFSIQAPLTVWLSAYFAGTQSIAEVGALGRLGVVFGLISGFMGAVLVPRLSAVTDARHYLRRYLQFWAVLAAFGAGVLAAAVAVPDWFLLLLGPAYRGLDEGVLLVAATSVLGTWGGYAVAINNARGWVRPQPAILVVFVITQIALAIAFDLSSTLGVLRFGLCSSLGGFLLQLLLNAAGFLRPAWVIVRNPEASVSRRT